MLVSLEYKKKVQIFAEIIKFLFCEEQKRAEFLIDFFTNFRIESNQFEKTSVLDIKNFVCQQLDEYYSLGDVSNE